MHDDGCDRRRRGSWSRRRIGTSLSRTCRSRPPFGGAIPTPGASFAHAALAVAEGDADAVLVLRGGAWDYAAVVVIVEEAGGTFSDLWGGRRLDTGTAVYSNATLHPAILAIAAVSRPAPPGPA